MKIKADVFVSNRALCSYNMKKPAKPTHAHIALGRKDEETFMMICTPQNRAGAKYLIEKGNVKEVRTRFVREGKATISFLKPEHDVCISKCDKVELLSFLKVLGNMLEGKKVEVTLSAMNPASNSQLAKEKKALFIDHKKDYPITTNFPHALESLTVNSVALKKFDSRMFRLKNLKTLNLENNQLKEIPAEIQRLRQLESLLLRHNFVAKIHCWDLPNLRVLNLSDNPLQVLPHRITDLKLLDTLQLNRCELTRLPLNIGRLKYLRNLHLDGNKISTLPGSMINLRLELIDLSGNPLLEADDDKSGKVLFDKLQFPPLLDLTISACFRLKIAISEEMIPSTVKRYADSYQTCPCGNVCFSSKALVAIPVMLSKIAKELSCDGRREALFEAFVCSHSCLNKYKDNPLAV